MHSRPVEMYKIKKIMIFDHKNKNFEKKFKKNDVSSYDVI